MNVDAIYSDLFPDESLPLEDPRDPAKISYPLESLLLMTLLAVLAGADSFGDMMEWVSVHEDELLEMFEFPSGRIPSHDTFERIFRIIPPSTTEAWTRALVASLMARESQPHIALDGKTARRTHGGDGSPKAMHMVSAWCESQSLVLGQLATGDKSNEIPTMAELIRSLDVEGAVLSMDAMHCQRSHVELICSKNADYLMTVKRNQHALHEELSALFAEDPSETAWQAKQRAKHLRTAQTLDKGHGRIDRRKITVYPSSESGTDWPRAKQVFRIDRWRKVGQENETHTVAYGITSLGAEDATAERLLSLVRNHWGVENRLHWSLDVVFREDWFRGRSGHEAENWARLLRIGVSVRLHATPSGRSSKGMRHRCYSPKRGLNLLHNLVMDEGDIGRLKRRNPPKK